jgi:hypothetical protein
MRLAAYRKRTDLAYRREDFVKASRPGVIFSSVVSGMACDGEEHVIQVGDMDGELIDLKTCVVELIEQTAQRRHVPVVGHLEDELVLVTGRLPQQPRRRVECLTARPRGSRNGTPCTEIRPAGLTEACARVGGSSNGKRFAGTRPALIYALTAICSYGNVTA